MAKSDGLNPDQMNRLNLGGTTGLPAPFPTIGEISLVGNFVHVTHNKTPSNAAIWSIAKEDVVALEEKSFVDPDPTKGQAEPIWHNGNEKVIDALSSNKRGIAYVREDAQVLLRLEYGARAIDSVDIATEADLGTRCRPCRRSVSVKCRRVC